MTSSALSIDLDVEILSDFCRSEQEVERKIDEFYFLEPGQIKKATEHVFSYSTRSDSITTEDLLPSIPLYLDGHIVFKRLN